MRSRGAFLTLVLVIGLVAAGAWFLDQKAGLQPARAMEGADTVASADAAPSGAWYCPHGGGTGWTGSVSIANPGDAPVTVRVASMTKHGRKPAEVLSVPARSRISVDVPANSREASTEVEYFGGWVGAGWVTHAPGTPAPGASPSSKPSPTPRPTGTTGGGGGESGSPSSAVESGVAADSCANGAGRTWFLADGSTVQGQEDYVVVMNPFASEASFELSFVAEARVVDVPGEITVPGGQAVAVHANRYDLGDQTAAAVVTTVIGRVVAASLGIDDAGGVRSDIGVSNGITDPVMPSAGDAGGTELPFLNPAKTGVTYGVDFLGGDGRHIALAPGQQIGPRLARTEALTATGPGAVSITPDHGATLVAARRTLGIRGDQGSTPALAPAAAWLLSSPATDRLDSADVALANTGPDPVTVTLTALTDTGPLPTGPVTVTVPPDSSVPSPPGFLDGNADASVVAVSDGGPFTAVMSATSKDEPAYAVSAGVPIPPQWVPAG